jgi:hypothetical protein
MNIFSHIIDGVVVNTIIADQWFIDLQDDDYTKSEDENGVTKNIEAEIGDIYDSIKDVFIKPKPFPSWILNEDSIWESPVSKPVYVEGQVLAWDEENLSWINIE